MCKTTVRVAASADESTGRFIPRESNTHGTKYLSRFLLNTDGLLKFYLKFVHFRHFVYKLSTDFTEAIS